MMSSYNRFTNDFPLRLLINRYYSGVIIGRSGTNMRLISAHSKTRIDITPYDDCDKLITIYGSQKSCSKACKSILELIAEDQKQRKGIISLCILTHNSLIGLLIGKNGNTLRSIMRETFTEIVISQRRATLSSIYWQRTITISSHDFVYVAVAEALVSKKLRYAYQKLLTAVMPYASSHNAYFYYAGGAEFQANQNREIEYKNPLDMDDIFENKDQYRQTTGDEVEQRNNYERIVHLPAEPNAAAFEEFQDLYDLPIHDDEQLAAEAAEAAESDFDSSVENMQNYYETYELMDNPMLGISAAASTSAAAAAAAAGANYMLTDNATYENTTYENTTYENTTYENTNYAYVETTSALHETTEQNLFYSAVQTQQLYADDNDGIDVNQFVYNISENCFETTTTSCYDINNYISNEPIVEIIETSQYNDEYAMGAANVPMPLVPYENNMPTCTVSGFPFTPCVQKYGGKYQIYANTSYLFDIQSVHEDSNQAYDEPETDGDMCEYYCITFNQPPPLLTGSRYNRNSSCDQHYAVGVLCDKQMEGSTAELPQPRAKSHSSWSVVDDMEDFYESKRLSDMHFDMYGSAAATAHYVSTLPLPRTCEFSIENSEADYENAEPADKTIANKYSIYRSATTQLNVPINFVDAHAYHYKQFCKQILPKFQNPKENVLVSILSCKKSVSIIIGRRGSYIRAIKQVSNIEMEVVDICSNSPFTYGNERKMILTGDPEAQWKAQYLIFTKLQREGYGYGKTNSCQILELLIPDFAIGKVIGAQGRNMAELQRLTGCTIRRPHKGRMNLIDSTFIPLHVHGNFIELQSVQRRIQSMIFMRDTHNISSILNLH